MRQSKEINIKEYKSNNSYEKSYYKLIFFLLAAFFGMNVSAQQLTMRSAFSNMKDDLLPLFTKNARLDFLDFIDSNMKAKVVNRLDSPSTMTELTDNYCKIELSENSTVEIKFLKLDRTKISSIQNSTYDLSSKLKSDTLICIVNSSKIDAWDSYLTFYTPEWDVLPSELFFDYPSVKTFISKREDMSESTYQNLLNMADIPYYYIQFVKDSDAITIEYESSYIKDHDYETNLKPFISNKISLHWNGIRFE